MCLSASRGLPFFHECREAGGEGDPENVGGTKSFVYLSYIYIFTICTHAHLHRYIYIYISTFIYMVAWRGERERVEGKKEENKHRRGGGQAKTEQHWSEDLKVEAP